MGLWITYAWKDNVEGNFDYLVQELEQYGVITHYDKVELIPGQRLWTQIAEKIYNEETQGWAYLITQNSLNSQPCIEELSYALDRALSTKENKFPLIGLVPSGVSFNDIPPALKIRLCVSLAAPDWREQVKAALELRAAKHFTQHQADLIYNVSQKFSGAKVVTVIEIRTRFNEIHNWRVAIPKKYKLLDTGMGEAGTGNLRAVKFGSLETSIEMENEDCYLRGESGPLTPGTSAYVLIENYVPDRIYFNKVDQTFGVPRGMYRLPLK